MHTKKCKRLEIKLNTFKIWGAEVCVQLHISAILLMISITKWAGWDPDQVHM